MGTGTYWVWGEFIGYRVAIEGVPFYYRCYCLYTIENKNEIRGNKMYKEI